MKIYYDDCFLQHDTGNHPENASRLTTVIDHLKKHPSWETWEHPTWKRAEIADILRVHEQEMLARSQQVAQQGGGPIDADTVVSENSFDVALLASGAAMDATRYVVENSGKKAFCLVRPPGHHATTDQAMGFCLINHIAVAASYATGVLKLKRVLIVDWDVHHGNGTQDIFWHSDSVAFFSMHRYPFYPGSGAADTIGEGEGLGFTKNLPISYGTESEEILETFRQMLRHFAERVKPDLVLLSAGFDAHAEDPVGDLGLATEDFAELTQAVVDVADTWCEGRLASMLEGGYHPQRLAESIEQHLNVLDQSEKASS